MTPWATLVTALIGSLVIVPLIWVMLIVQANITAASKPTRDSQRFWRMVIVQGCLTAVLLAFAIPLVFLALFGTAAIGGSVANVVSAPAPRGVASVAALLVTVAAGTLAVRFLWSVPRRIRQACLVRSPAGTMGVTAAGLASLLTLAFAAGSTFVLVVGLIVGVL